MSRFSIILQILKNAMFKPQLLQELSKERAEIKDDEKFRTHKYSYNFNSTSDFFKKKFPNVQINEFEQELDELNEHVNNFFKSLQTKKYPSKDKPYPIDYSINSDSRKFLYILCRILKPKNVIETGVAYGLSSSYILKALDKNQSGTLHSIDSIFRPWQSENMIGAVIPENLRHRWNFNLGKSTEKLQQVFEELNGVDIFIHDSLHTYKNMMFEFECAEENLSENGIIISDDVLDNDAFFNFSNRDSLDSHLIKVNDDLGLGLIIKN
ncbi:MAG: hypothetical protein CL763_09870 [Chloroflexi bacterium]|nr:hypothetical protein [Chloroflexota bacterium]